VGVFDDCKGSGGNGGGHGDKLRGGEIATGAGGVGNLGRG
jgi:hypothetical protein